MQLSYTDAVELLLKAKKKFDFPVGVLLFACFLTCIFWPVSLHPYFCHFSLNCNELLLHMVGEMGM